MSRRALLVGSGTYGLEGCEGDVELMRAMLAARRFDPIDVRVRGDATRAGILAGLDELVAATRPGDTVVVYYSGHGGRVARPDADERRAAGRSPYFHFVVPYDMADSAPGDFRGLLSEELTLFQRRLAEAFGGTPVDATTILDCCHSGYLARDARARPRSVDFESRMFTMRGIRDHAQQLGADAELRGAATNPDVVRLVACQPEQSAYELPVERGGTHGAFTDAIVTVLDAIGDAVVPWAVVADLVRRRVRAAVPEQRPEVEGPSRRAVFSAAALPDAAAMPLVADGDELRIAAAELVGVAVGDEFRLVVPGREELLATVTVGSVRDGDAVLDVPAALAREAGSSAIAVPARISVPKLQVDVGDAAGPLAAVAEAIEGSRRLATGSTDAFARVLSSDDGLVLADHLGEPWRTDRFPPDQAGARAIVEVLTEIAIGQRLLDLGSGEPPDATPELSFGVVTATGREPRSLYGERLAVGQQVYLAIRNTGDRELFAWVYDVGVSGRSSLVTNAAPSGTRLGPAGSEDDTLDVWGPSGTALFWPADVPVAASGRDETFVVLTCDRRNDLSSLSSRDAGARRGDRSPLDALLDEVRVGVRDVAPATGASGTRYRLDRIELVLVPR